MICGSDFMQDLLGLIDILSPLVVFMLSCNHDASQSGS